MYLLNFPNKIENETLFSRVVHLSYILSPISILRYTLQRRGHEHRVPYSMIMAIIEIWAELQLLLGCKNRPSCEMHMSAKLPFDDDDANWVFFMGKSSSSKKEEHQVMT